MWGQPATALEIAGHARRILAADLADPLILSAEGVLLDGGHRLAKAWILGLETVAVVRLRVTPEPDQRLPMAQVRPRRAVGRPHR